VTSRQGRRFPPRLSWWLPIVLVAVAAFGLAALLHKGPRAGLSAESQLAMLDDAIAGDGIEQVIDTGEAEVTAALALKRELVTADRTGRVRVWARSSGRLLGETDAAVPIAALAETESSSRFLAAADRRGAILLIDVTDPGQPRVLPLDAAMASGRPPLAIGYTDEGDEVVAVGGRGELLRVDITTGRVTSRSSLLGFRGRLPWSGADRLRLTAARFVPQVYEEEGLLVATADGAVADLDLDREQGKTVLAADVSPGRVLDVDRVSYGQPQLAVGTSEGLVFLDGEEFGDEPQVVPGPAVPAVAIDEEGLRQGGREGLSFGEYLEAPPSGPAVLRFEPGPHGIAVICPRGKVGVLGPPGVGISLAETTTTPVVAFDPRGRLLIAEGYDADHIESIRAIRPQPRPLEGEYPEDEIVATLRPDPGWWPEAKDPEALYLNDVVADAEYVAAAGQDPDGDAAVMVWDAESGKPLHHLAMKTEQSSSGLPNVATETMLLPESDRIAAYSVARKSVAIWSTETWRLEESIPVGAAGEIALSPDGSTLVAIGAGADREGYVEPGERTDLTFVDLEEGEVESEVEAKGVTVAAFSPDGSTLAMVDQTGFLRLRSADGREPRGPLLRVGGGAEDLAWRPDGGLIAVALSQGGVVLADPESGMVSKPLPHEPFIPTIHLAWSADGGLLASLNAEIDEEGSRYPAPASIWTLSPSSLQRRLCELSACGSGEEEPSPGSRLGDAAQLESVDMAFREEGDLWVADLEGNRARIGYLEGEYPTPPVSYDWSEHGFAWSAAGQVGVLLSGESAPRSWPCACSGVAWDGGEVLSLGQKGRRLVRIDPRRGRLRTTPVHALPPHLPGLLGIVSGTPIVAAYKSRPDRGTPSALFEIGSDGTAVELLGNAHGGIYLRWPSSSPRSLAFLASLSGGVCYSTTNVGVVEDEGDGRIELEFPPSPLGREPTWIRSLQVSAKGRVSAAIAPIGCDDRGYPEDEVPPAERYLLEHGRWQPTGAEGFDVQATGDAQLIQESQSFSEPGPLFADDDGEREEIAPEAEGLVVRP
jgi:hypothetical protein